VRILITFCVQKINFTLHFRKQHFPIKILSILLKTCRVASASLCIVLVWRWSVVVSYVYGRELRKSRTECGCTRSSKHRRSSRNRAARTWLCVRARLAGAVLSHPIQRIAFAQKHRDRVLVGVRSCREINGEKIGTTAISKYRCSITRACVSMLLFGELTSLGQKDSRKFFFDYN